MDVANCLRSSSRRMLSRYAQGALADDASVSISSLLSLLHALLQHPGSLAPQTLSDLRDTADAICFSRRLLLSDRRARSALACKRH